MDARLAHQKKSYRIKKNFDPLMVFLFDNHFKDFEKNFSFDKNQIIFEYFHAQDSKQIEDGLYEFSDYLASVNTETRFLLSTIGLNKVSLKLEQRSGELTLYFLNTQQTKFDHPHQNKIYKNFKLSMLGFSGSVLLEEDEKIVVSLNFGGALDV